MSEVVIRFDRVSKRYGRQVALREFSCEVPAGVVFALLGENGAGKTTAIKSLLGLVEPEGGQVEVLGLNSRRRGVDIRRQVGYVSERPALYEWMSVEEIGWFVAGFHGPGYLENYRDLVGRFELPPQQKIRGLSKGMRAKISLSLAMAHDPSLLVLDEPTSGLDTMVRREFLESMVDRAASGRTVFLSSHQIHEVERVADIVAILRDGELLLVESLETLKHQVRELTVTMANGKPAPPQLPGEIIRRQSHPRQWQLLARDVDAARLSDWRRDESIGSLEVRSPGLEEIFVAYMKGPHEEVTVA